MVIVGVRVGQGGGGRRGGGRRGDGVCGVGGVGGVGIGGRVEVGVVEGPVGELCVEGGEGKVVFCDVNREVGVVMVEHGSREEEPSEKRPFC